MRANSAGMARLKATAGTMPASRMRTCDYHEAEVVVVYVSARQPRIVGRKVAGLGHRVQVSELHWLLSTEGEVPQIGVPHPYQPQEQEGPQEHELVDKNQRSMRREESKQLSPLLACNCR